MHHLPSPCAPALLLPSFSGACHYRCCVGTEVLPVLGSLCLSCCCCSPLHAARQTGRCCVVLDRGTSRLPREAGWLCQCPAWAGLGQVLAERPPPLQCELLGKGYLCLGDRVVPEGPSTAWLRSQTLGELGCTVAFFSTLPTAW